MKNLNITFEDKEFERIESLKKKSGLGWRDFLQLIITHINDSIKKGTLEFNKA